MKYIMYDDDSFVIFSDRIKHNEIDITKIIRSAGFIDLKVDKSTDVITGVHCFGDSITLNKCSLGREDSFIIELELGL